MSLLFVSRPLLFIHCIIDNISIDYNNFANL
jgi:hypothetical protein